MTAGTITLGTPLASGGTINVHFLLGVQQNGNYRFLVNVESLPAAIGPNSNAASKGRGEAGEKTKQ